MYLKELGLHVRQCACNEMLKCDSFVLGFGAEVQ